MAKEKLPHLNIYGDDYPAPDGVRVGTCINVMNWADGYLAALNYLKQENEREAIKKRGYAIMAIRISNDIRDSSDRGYCLDLFG